MYRLRKYSSIALARQRCCDVSIPVKPWREAGVTLADWRKARRAVVGLVADLVWRARGSKDGRPLEREAAMQRLSRIAEGDPESTRYGLDLAHGDEEYSERTD
jgi:hypothetical protein